MMGGGGGTHPQIALHWRASIFHFPFSIFYFRFSIFDFPSKINVVSSWPSAGRRFPAARCWRLPAPRPSRATRPSVPAPPLRPASLPPPPPPPPPPRPHPATHST